MLEDEKEWAAKTERDFASGLAALLALISAVLIGAFMWGVLLPLFKEMIDVYW